MMIGQNVSVLLRTRNLVGLSFSVNKLHSSYRQCLHSNPLRVPVKLAYASYESLKKNEQNLPPIIIMHGLFGSKNNWNSLSKTIHEKTKRKVIAVDARNHGDSPHTSDMSYKDMAEDVIQLMQDLGLDKALLVGHSMGGSAMMYTALNYPRNIEKLVVVDMSPVRTSPNLAQMATIFEAMRSMNVDGSPNLSKARQVANKQFAKYIKSLALRQFLAANLVEVDSGGGNSDYIRLKDHDAIRTLFHRAEFHYVNGANHWVHADNPDEFVDVLTNFVNRPLPS
ncbi:PREDICTED: alpha/beta hydrolase domain-containing protein 11-like isoform X2 [Dinoponera quadriceps]|uniref:sn-1-specific diacylglycerol lipase ABHD11 n=1 Tax=Dinoponera quadriceps TaxID=609295 RepID=A0A6P3XS27_DINQU|nr:PREDICTED: alpha/beta hydrolase domain-containing protein 11-like isoform X2 [Dinoponera quadriceps]